MILSRLAGRDNRHATGRCVDPGSRQSSVLFGSCLRITSRHRGMAIDAGFSLVEVMLSLTLAILLLGAIYAAIGQSWRITASGREEITRSQVARAIEVSITFRPVETQAGILTNVAVSSSSNQFRTVIVVPTADPLPPELQP